MSERRTFAVTTTGKGRPDYQAEVWRSKTEADILHSLHFNERFKLFYLCPTAAALAPPFRFPFVVDPMPPIPAVRSTEILIDVDTGLAMPYTTPIGTELQITMLWSTFNQNLRMRTWIDGLIAIEGYTDAFTTLMYNEVVSTSTADIDPTFAAAHTLLVQGTNLGAADLSGTAKVICIERIHGTELSTTKTVRCAWCGHTKVVPNETTLLTCPSPKCGNQTVFQHHPWGGTVKLPARTRVEKAQQPTLYKKMSGQRGRGQ
ncbi:hypothetical protein D4R42_02505 [bacterium]|nr:MAG: hypothetical protein D4R42_02505 [bacterium]